MAHAYLFLLLQDHNQLLPGQPGRGGPAHLAVVPLDVSGGVLEPALQPAARLLQAGRLLPGGVHRGRRANPLGHLL